MDRDLEPSEVRVLGCLIEKQRTTPDAYPLSLNALRLACNQSTNRDPVVSYDEDTVRDALHRLGRRRYTRLASGHSSRASKYRHLLDEALGLDAAEQSVLAVLLLRGPQTPGELKQRTERMQPLADLAALQDLLTALIDRGFVAQLARRPGQKEERYRHRLSEDVEGAAVEAAAPEAAVVPPPPRRDERLDRLESEVAELRQQLETLRQELGL
jgi:uncharacterized protein YceH (UPF0502 family)